MIDEEVRAVTLAVMFVVLVLIVAPVLMPKNTESFSEIGLLGSNMKIGDYPNTIAANQKTNLYLYLGNHEGRIMYYLVYVKLGDKTTFINDTVPANVSVVATYESILADGQNCTIPVNLSLANPMSNARLIFELWIIEDSESKPKYHGRWLHLWINVTQ